MKVFLSPHNDDETLFGAFTLHRERPLVIVCLRSFVQRKRGGPRYEIREAETETAMGILGCDWRQWHFPDDLPPWDRVEKAMRDLDDVLAPETVYAPAVNFETNGWTEEEHPAGWGLFHHDKIGALADRIFGDRVVAYQTYTRWGGRTETGTVVAPSSPDAIGAKLAALACYQSQIADESTRKWFLGPLTEYLA